VQVVAILLLSHCLGKELRLNARNNGGLGKELRLIRVARLVEWHEHREEDMLALSRLIRALSSLHGWEVGPEYILDSIQEKGGLNRRGATRYIV